MPDMRLEAVLTAKDEASAKIKGLGGAVSDLGKRLKSDLKIAAVAAGAAIVGFGITSVKAFEESQNAITQTNAVLKSTGGIAGVTADMVDKLASSFQRQTRYSDEAVREGMNLLLTFTKIGKDVFPQATEIMLNMSTALGQDLKSSAIQLGKALQDPILGVTALRRVGVNFNEEAKNTIERMVEMGDTAGAQAFIMKELQVEFGGAAVAAGTTFAGQIDKLKNSINDLQETIGGTIANQLLPLLTHFNEWAASEGAKQQVERLTNSMVNFANQIANVVSWLSKHKWAAEALGIALLGIAAVVGSPVAALLLIIAVLIQLGRIIANVIGLVKDLYNALKSMSRLSLKDRLKGLIGFQSGGIMPYTGLAYLHKGERITPSGLVAGGGGGGTVVNFYGNINNTSNAELDSIGLRIARQLSLAKMGAL